MLIGIAVHTSIIGIIQLLLRYLSVHLLFIGLVDVCARGIVVVDQEARAVAAALLHDACPARSDGATLDAARAERGLLIKQRRRAARDLLRRAMAQLLPEHRPFGLYRWIVRANSPSSVRLIRFGAAYALIESVAPLRLLRAVPIDDIGDVHGKLVLLLFRRPPVEAVEEGAPAHALRRSPDCQLPREPALRRRARGRIVPAVALCWQVLLLWLHCLIIIIKNVGNRFFEKER